MIICFEICGKDTSFLVCCGLIFPEIRAWETITPYFEKRNIHFYVNRCGFHIVEFWKKYHHGPVIPDEIDENWSEDDEMFVFKKEV